MSRSFSPATTSIAGELTAECGEEGVYVHSNDWSVEAVAAFGSLPLPFLAIVEGKSWNPRLDNTRCTNHRQRKREGNRGEMEGRLNLFFQRAANRIEESNILFPPIGCGFGPYPCVLINQPQYSHPPRNVELRKKFKAFLFVVRSEESEPHKSWLRYCLYWDEFPQEDNHR